MASDGWADRQGIVAAQPRLSEIPCGQRLTVSGLFAGQMSGDTQDGPLPINAARLLILSVGLARS
jgi:hypothetical protein